MQYRWKFFRQLDVVGQDIVTARPYGADDEQGARLFERISNIKQGNPLSLEKAVWMFSEMASEVFVKQGAVAFLDAFEKWVEILAEQGFRIELQPNDYTVSDCLQ